MARQKISLHDYVTGMLNTAAMWRNFAKQDKEWLAKYGPDTRVQADYERHLANARSCIDAVKRDQIGYVDPGFTFWPDK